MTNTAHAGCVVMPGTSNYQCQCIDGREQLSEECVLCKSDLVLIIAYHYPHLHYFPTEKTVKNTVGLFRLRDGSTV